MFVLLLSSFVLVIDTKPVFIKATATTFVHTPLLYSEPG